MEDEVTMEIEGQATEAAAEEIEEAQEAEEAEEMEDGEIHMNPPNDNNVQNTVEKHTHITNSQEENKADVSMNESNVEDSDQICPICMEQWTSSGDHRLCCLRCGHLFGHSCILKWLQCSVSTNRRCPQCNKKALVKHIRFLYARKLSSRDTGELEKIKKDLHNVTTEKNKKETELSQCNIRLKIYEQKVASLQHRIAELENQQTEINTYINQTASGSSVRKFHLERSIDIYKNGDCRVLDYNPWYKVLFVSQKTESNALFSGYGVRKIDPMNFQAWQLIFLHHLAIRDIKFHSMQPSLLLSVGFDKCAKLMDVQNNMILHTFKTESPLWSCCWSGDNSNLLLVGAQNGSITRFDIRQISSPVDTLDGQSDKSPVVSMTTVQPNPGSGIGRGGFIACRLNTCYVYESKNASYLPKQVFLEGPFISVRYDEKSKHALISSRPNARQPHARHAVCTIERGSEEIIMCSVVHTFNAGNSQRLLSRPCHIYTENDTLVAAHQEANSNISIWSVTSGKQLQILPVSDPVMDLCSFTVHNDLLLANLSTNKVRLYNYGQIGCA
ncbi:E3 ubiquitin-protein ligase RFWD3-like isoform X2 [Odontomachus brunneus]|uniref:E3 ubiquitin-protein ligase RFWD3-like isoform X2 n=1 Tax=Odontomachus brunneus TaxID=486640 RepID=UPI0013F1E793|nr:E3 ubiquitin-protein ligase RFWD3-like isoform X2 [Odontomachus brunneus]